MDLAASSIAASPAPTFVADTRPSADVAASKTTREPPLAFAPTGMAPNTSQAATVSRGLLLATGVEEPRDSGAVSAIERTLKPYSTPMLPERVKTDAPPQAETDDTTAAEPASDPTPEAATSSVREPDGKRDSTSETGFGTGPDSKPAAVSATDPEATDEDRT